MKNQSLVKGTLILTIAYAITKILGFIYIVPFTAMVGLKGNILYEYSFKPYVLMLSMTTMGIPLAISKFVAKYNELGERNTVKKMIKSSTILMIIGGTVSTILLFYLAPIIAKQLVDINDTTGNNINDVINVIKIISIALLIVPLLTVLRGYFQGFKYMTPTAISQVIEQLFRVVFMLSSTYLLIYVFNWSVNKAVGVAVLGAFVGGLAGFLTLAYFWWKTKNDGLINGNGNLVKTERSYIYIYKELFSYAIPFVLTALAIDLYQTIDTFTINKALMSIGLNQAKAETINSIVSLNQKVIRIPVSFGNALGMALIPVITSLFASGDRRQLQEQIKQAFFIVLYLMTPIIIILMLLSDSTYYILFGNKELVTGAKLLMWYAPTILLFSLYLITTPILQGINKHWITIFGLFIGVLIKILTNFIFIRKYQGIGSILTTNFGFIISIIINVYFIKKYSGLHLRSMLKSIFKLIGLNLGLCIVIYLTKQIFINFVSYKSILFFHIELYVFIGIVTVIFYLIMSYVMGIFYQVPFFQRYKFLSVKRNMAK